MNTGKPWLSRKNFVFYHYQSKHPCSLFAFYGKPSPKGTQVVIRVILLLFFVVINLYLICFYCLLLLFAMYLFFIILYCFYYMARYSRCCANNEKPNKNKGVGGSSEDLFTLVMVCRYYMCRRLLPSMKYR